MIYEFGLFRLDEEARLLSLSGEEVSLQPRVFDLMVYLLRSNARVVSKEELLYALWPGVTVTENSLQRAVSTLRNVLRRGGMEDAIRNFPRAGYRFSGDVANQAPETQPALEAAPPLEAARAALLEQRWREAVDAFATIDAKQKLPPQDIEGWSFALQCLGKPSEAIPLLARAVSGYVAAGDDRSAAHCAITLSTIHLERGETAMARGWVARARDLSESASGSAAEGEVLWMEARIAGTDGEPERAVELAGAAYAFGRSHADARVEALGLMYRGFYRLSMGDIRGGLADQDHAAALALSQETDPITGGVLYCNILWACRTFGDWARANEWTLGYRNFCSRHQMEFSGSCQLHRAECLGVQGSLEEARDFVVEAIERLPSDAPWALGDANRVLGDIESAIGNEDEAMAAYARCHSLGWDAEPGHAMLLMARGQVDAACASLERSLIGRGWWTLQRRDTILAHLALAHALAGDEDKARAIIRELTGERKDMVPSVAATAHEAKAVADLNGGKRIEALNELYLARQLWMNLGSRFNAARIRLRIADLQVALNDLQGAAEEAKAALEAGKELRASGIVRNAAALLAQIASPAAKG